MVPRPSFVAAPAFVLDRHEVLGVTQEANVRIATPDFTASRSRIFVRPYFCSPLFLACYSSPHPSRDPGTRLHQRGVDLRGWLASSTAAIPTKRSSPSRCVASSAINSDRDGAAMLRSFAAALLGLFCFGTSTVWALDCFPHCDYYNDYGPYVIGPSLYCNPRCGLQGNCSPFLECKQQSHGIHKSNPETASPCLPDTGRCTSNYQCCSGSCNWSERAHAYFCGSGLLFSRHPPRPSPQ